MNAERAHIDLFSGLGCFAIAARANGVQTLAFCEAKEDCANFLTAQWGLPVHRDARTLDATQYRGVWLITGGPPCQPASRAGKQRGAEDDRWLWPEAIRIVKQAQPTWFLFENPPGIRDVGLDGIIADMEAIGYEVGILDIPACAVDSPQRRHRLWIVGHAKSLDRRLQLQPGRQNETGAEFAGAIENRAMAIPNGERFTRGMQPLREAGQGRAEADQRVQNGDVANTESKSSWSRLCDPRAVGTWDKFANSAGGGGLWSEYNWIPCGDGKYRRAKPGIRGVAHGNSVGLLEALGNAIVWPVAARIIAAIIQAEELQTA